MAAARGPSSFGVVVAVVGALLFFITIIVFVAPLPDKLDTALVVAWLFVPGIVGGLIYAKMERDHSFDEHRPLR